LAILNHTVQYTRMGDGMQWEAERPPRCPAIQLTSRSNRVGATRRLAVPETADR